MPQFTTRTTYTGDEKLIFAIDIGTTHSAVSFAHLFPGRQAVIHSVIKWPDELPGESKVPSILAYKDGELVACGASALEHEVDREYYMVKWFKLHVHPQSMKVAEHADSEMKEWTNMVPPLPSDIPLKRVYRDLLQYLFNHARNFYLQQPGATAVWKRLENNRYFVFTTPNGWDTIQHQFLLQAAVDADLVGGNDADLHVDFISEGEASVHFSVANSESTSWLKEGMLFALIDAGGSTVDSTLYKCNKRSPRLVLSEQCASVCIQTGGVFVDVAARNLLKQRFSGTKFCHSTCIDRIMKEFEMSIKRGFGEPNQSTSMPVEFLGSEDDNELRISNRRLEFTIEEINGIFEGVTNSILDSCETMLSGCDVKSILLVGGFGDSPHLRGRLKERFSHRDIKIVSLNEPWKAAAEGAVQWYIEQLVTSRCARYTIGADTRTRYTRKIPIERDITVYKDVKGDYRVPGSFQIWLKKNEIINETTRKSFTYVNAYNNPPTFLPAFTLAIYAWQGDEFTQWSRDLDGRLYPQMRPLCNLKADLSNLRLTVQPKSQADGTSYWEMRFEVEIWYRGTKLQAKIKWEDQGQIREGRVAVLPNDALA